MADFGATVGIKHPCYPENLGSPPVDKWIQFTVKSGRHVFRNNILPDVGSNLDAPIASVGLYLSPSALKDTLQVTYDQNDFGVNVGAAVEFLAQTGQNIFGSKGNAVDPLSSMFSSVMKQLKAIVPTNREELKDVVFTAGSWAQADLNIGIDDLGGKGAGSVIMGGRPNPRTDIFFDTQQYREHTFNFMLIPRNIREAEAIDHIIRIFQYYMLPAYQATKLLNAVNVGAFMIGFPYEFEIEFLDRFSRPLEHVNKVGRSVLKKVSIDHAAGDGKTAFVKEDGQYYPVATELSLDFMEVQLLGRDSKVIERAGVPELTDPRIK